MAASWRDYWNGDTPIYVSERHKLLHYAALARDIAELIVELSPDRPPVLLDYGCGDALGAARIAGSCARLILSDGAPNVRQRLAERLQETGIDILSPEEVEALPPASLDLVLVNSLAQYLARTELERLLDLFQGKLKDGGRLVLADIIPPDVSAVADAAALLGFAGRGGFLTAATIGLARTALSDYRRTRSSLGLAHYEEGEMLALLGRHGFEATRRTRNLGHNPRRMTFVASKGGNEGDGAGAAGG